jgi:hypothetical protein
MMKRRGRVYLKQGKVGQSISDAYEKAWLMILKLLKEVKKKAKR